MKLNEIGIMVQREYLQLKTKYPNIKCNEFVIMPNHFHCIIEIVENTKGGKTPPLPNIIGYFKFQTTKIYYENIIRTEDVHLKVSEYIKNNPINCVEDRYYE